MARRLFLFYLVLNFLILNATQIVNGDESSADRLKLKTERVVVFKDGHCLVVKQGSATTNTDGIVFTEEVPDSAILGSFWAVPEKGSIKSMVAGWVESETNSTRTVSCTSVIEIVKANLGKTCSFNIGADQKLEGRLLKVLADDKPSSVTPLNQDAKTEDSLSVSQVIGDFFILGTTNGDVMVATKSVENLTIDNMNSTHKQAVTRKTLNKRLSLQFGQPNTKVKINLMYFRPDVRWIPTYRINLTDQNFASGDSKVDRKMAEVFMQGEILNEAEDFDDVPFHVVVGVPNFRFKSVSSPMVLESSVHSVLAQTDPTLMSQSGNGFNTFSNAIYTQRSSEFRSNRAADVIDRAGVELTGDLAGKGGNDLFVYELSKMTLKKGERATVPILRTKVAYRDIYTWDVEVTHAESYSSSPAGSASPLVLSENKVWRQIELINDTDLPWTTGAAMFMDGFQPLAQELLTYTSPGGIVRVPVTVSVDLKGRVEDAEVKRELKALKWRGKDYAKIHGKVDLELANNKEEAVNVEVRVRFGGKGVQANEGGKISLEGFRQEDWLNRQGDSINNSSAVSWTSSIDPGECFKPTVDYEFLLRY